MPHHGEAEVAVGGIRQGRYFTGLWKLHGGAAAVTVNRVYVYPLEHLTRTITIDALTYLNGGAIAGQFRIALYGTGVPNPDLPDGAPLILMSAPIAVAPLMNEWLSAILHQFVPVDGTDIIGWVAVIFDDVGNVLYNTSGTDHIGNQAVTSRQYDAGAFTMLNPCPVTAFATRTSVVACRVVSVP